MAQQHLNAERLRLEKADGSVSKEEKQELERLWGFEHVGAEERHDYESTMVNSREIVIVMGLYSCLVD
ncbi:hypothetical protein BOTNAR_0296g00070 [Botryotinia narcissicola]|uniref:Uncharacterized protein n=1 Tax=Botryotinia narcissicola TaxID=278944 RepID=A0A4Z1I902_9HELO|nr:hypothetical protein BOTNAR_0296g00070 [Botryotinia narcissicola]